ncbi:MAG TPA: hypothetical protein VGS27_32565 [Candidatus Sulfotelmatobacter sp.]|nr:hypothetical protein [Candidatus Sulfotelmatobacter sp.]
MRAGVLNAGWFGFARPAEARGQEGPVAVERTRPRVAVWDAERFASDQIQNLVRTVFDERATPPVRQIVLSAIDPDIDIQSLCEKVGKALAAQTAKDVAVVRRQSSEQISSVHASNSLRQSAFPLGTNVWLLSIEVNHQEEYGTGSLYQFLDKVRSEFDYSLVTAQPGALNEAIAAGRLADGTVLVLSAAKTRRASASRFLTGLRGVRVLGTVLIDRDFPMPEAIYRRL